MSDPVTPTPHSTGGNVRWEPPSPAELEAQMPGYTIEKLLGRGGMGAVYKGLQSNLDRPVAIKILPPGVEQEDPSFAERFKNEARLMARLNNPAVVSVHDFGLTNGGLLYFAMEYVDGTDVSQMIRSLGRLPPEHALAITAHVCDALSAAHELGIVHRDIKPANVLINRKGQVKVADFGLAKVEEPGTHGLTKTGYAMGTPDFVAPEVLMLGSHIDGRADLYAVGVMLYQMLTGEVPRGAFKPATARLPGLDPRFDPIILKAMQSDREERYQSSTELRRDLDVILTVPFVRQDEPPTSAIPAAQLAQTPAQRSAVQKTRSADAPVGQPAKAGEGTRAPMPPKKSSAPLLLGLTAAAAIGIGAFVMLGGSGSRQAAEEDAKGSASPQTTAQNTPPTTTKPPTSGLTSPSNKLTSPAVASTSAVPAASGTGKSAASQIPPAKSPQPARLPDPSKWVKAFETPKSLESFKGQAEWTQSGIHLTGTIKPTNSVLQDAAIRLKAKKGIPIGLILRGTKGTQWAANINTTQSYANFVVSSDDAESITQRFEVPPSLAALEEIQIEFVGVGNILSLSMNGVQVGSMAAPAKTSTGMLHIFSADGYVRDIAWQSLDGPAPAPDKTAIIATTPSPALPVSSSPVPAATTMAAAVPASELDQRLAAIESGFQAAVERDANATFKASMAALDKSYLGALDRALGTATSGGKLEEALALREEKQRIEKGEGVPSEVDESTLAPGKVPETLKTLRKTYRSTTAQHEATKLKAMQPLYDKYDQALAAVQTELTQAQKLDDALRVKTVREQIAAVRDQSSPELQLGQASPAGNANEAPSSTGGLKPTTTLAAASTLLATKDKPFTNSLGMKFVPVTGTDVLFCIHETRYKDYAAFVAEVDGMNTAWKDQTADGFTITDRPADHPVAHTSWEHAQAFCAWLSQKEGRLYRLPTDEEWSYAVGIGRDEKRKKDDTPSSLHQKKVLDEYPWGKKLPPPRGAGNYSDQSRKTKAPRDGANYLDGYDDGFPTTAPVMSFKPDKLGLYDLGGNVWEWCEDWYDGTQKDRVLRGGSWDHYDNSTPLSSDRLHYAPLIHNTRFGFRVVLAKSGAAPAPLSAPTTKPATPTPAAPAAPAPTPATAAKSDFTNSLGMKFVKVPGIKVLFCIHETRKGDYAKYAAEVTGVDDKWQNPVTAANKTPVSTADDHPVVNVSWEDDQAFCAWLGKKEGRTYRLPTDREWSFAVGIGRDEKEGESPFDLNAKVQGEYPWGKKWPPPQGVGNYADTTEHTAFPNDKMIEGYTDGYATTAPVMCFSPNKLGIYDLGGNVWELCEDWFKAGSLRTTRGAAWNTSNLSEALSSTRGYKEPGPVSRHHSTGFRIVLETTE